MSGIGISIDNIDTMLSRALAQCVETIKTNSRNAGQVATGKTLRSLEYTLHREGKAYIARILGRPYFGTLETGRGPYAGGKGDPAGFNQRLIEWMKARNFRRRRENLLVQVARALSFIDQRERSNFIKSVQEIEREQDMQRRGTQRG